jgi:poly(U)-specific endoribonuclease
MPNIYQDIWSADMTGNGMVAIFDDEEGDAEKGYVKVNRHAFSPGPADEVLKVITEVKVPDAKMRTYELVRRLLDNYALDEKLIEVETPQEREEVHDLVQAMIDTAPMQVARSYVQNASGTTISKERWYSTLMDMWFRPFAEGNRPALSGFEHVVVGEQKGSTINGYHFWYKYWLDDNFANQVDGTRERFPGLKDDRIVYIRSKSDQRQQDFPESVTISYRWDAPDYERKAIRPLVKPTGGFFVGCSVEGLLAMGTVRAHLGARAPKEAVINGARYDLKAFRSADDQHVRTFYPMFLGPAAEAPQPIPVDPGEPRPPQPVPPPSVVTGPVRIVAALVNPVGADPGREAITLVNTAPTAVPLAGWRLVDKERHHFEIADVTLPGGTGTTIVLPPNTMQLSNRGGEIRLVDRTGSTVHFVSYSKAQASREGETIVF